jgi:hypothetical protein
VKGLMEIKMEQMQPEENKNLGADLMMLVKLGITQHVLGVSRHKIICSPFLNLTNTFSVDWYVLSIATKRIKTSELIYCSYFINKNYVYYSGKEGCNTVVQKSKTHWGRKRV